MKCSTALLNAHIVTSTKNLTVGRDQSCANGHTTFGSTLSRFFERSLKTNVILHFGSNSFGHYRSRNRKYVLKINLHLW